MLRHTARITAVAALFALCYPAWADQALDQRIARVENGLRGPFAVKGRPAPTASIAQSMAELRVPGVSVAVINNGKIEWARAYGVVEAGSNRPVTTATLFQAASISKPVSALGALYLVEQGKLSLDEDVNQKLTQWKLPAGAQSAASPVTLRNLLNHSAGATVHGFQGYATGVPVPSLVQVLDGAKPANSPPVRIDTLPNTQWRYSGGGYSVAQLLMASASGKAFPSFMQDAVLNPLGMKHSTFAQPVPAALHSAAASAHDEQGKPIPGRWHTYPEQAAAGLWSTPSDLARFAIGLQEAVAGKPNKVISQAMAKQMLTKIKGAYGMGIEVRDVDGQRSFRHNGLNRGFYGDMWALIDGRQGVVVMTNANQGSALVGAIMRSVAAEYGWKDMRVVEKPVVAVNATTLARYAGTYRLGPMTIKVIQDGTRLLVSAPSLGPNPREIHAASQTSFFNLQDWQTVDFDANPAGTFDMIVHADQTYRATRVP